MAPNTFRIHAYIKPYKASYNKNKHDQYCEDMHVYISCNSSRGMGCAQKEMNDGTTVKITMKSNHENNRHYNNNANTKNRCIDKLSIKSFS